MKKIQILYHYLKTKYGLKPRTIDALKRLQQKKFIKLQKHVLSNSQHFKEFAANSLSQYPIMNKTIMMNKFNSINTAGIDKAQAFALAIEAENTRHFTPTLKGYTVGLSSGTSGNKGLFLVSETEQAVWLGQILANMLPGSLFSKHRVALFMRANSNLYETIGSQNKLSFQYFDLSLPLDTLLSACHNYHPTILVAPPKILKMIAQSKNLRNIDIKPKKIITIADVLETQDKQTIEQAYGQTVHQIYQCTEGFLANTCELGTLHLNEETVIFEKEWINQDLGKFIPIITDLQRQTQPIVRYRLDDILTIKKEGCDCKCIGLAIEKIEGREDQILYFKHQQDSALHPVLPDFIRRAIMTADDAIEEYQVTQPCPDTMKVGLKTDKDSAQVHVNDNLVALLKSNGLSIPNISFVPYKEKKPYQKQMRVQREFIIYE